MDYLPITIQMMLEKAVSLRFSITADSYHLYDDSEISSLIRHSPPYLSLTQAVCGRKDSSLLFVFARASFSEKECDGHYPGFPSLPLTEINRTMDQTAALFTVLSETGVHGKIPLLRRISKLKGGSIERFDPINPCWIWASIYNGELKTIFFSGLNSSPVASTDGWMYEFKKESDFQASLIDNNVCSPYPSFSELGRADIMKFIPQTPPFLILESANITKNKSGHSMINAHALVLPEMKCGHLGRKTTLGPMHFARALAQSGMVLCTHEFFHLNCIPEVMSASGIWYDTSAYFLNQNNITVSARIDKFIQKNNLNVAKVSGDLICEDRKMFGAESLNYILIPKTLHPINTL